MATRLRPFFSTHGLQGETLPTAVVSGHTPAWATQRGSEGRAAPNVNYIQETAIAGPDDTIKKGPYLNDVYEWRKVQADENQ